MIISDAPIAGDDVRIRAAPNASAHGSAVSWGAILAGAAAAAALSLILLLLGTGLGLSSVSPWAARGVRATTIGWSSIGWVTLTQLLASGLGGYLAGRLRTKWIGAHTDEVYFRDTAHGFLAWAVASLATAALLVSVIGSIVSTGAQASASVAEGAANAAGMAARSGAGDAIGSAARGDSNASPSSTSYFVDSLFRKPAGAATPAAPGIAGTTSSSANTPASTPASTDGNSAASTAEVTRIFLASGGKGELPPEDVQYLGQLIAQRTGLSQADAEKRVNDTYARLQAKLRDTETAAKEAADKARKASAHAALWLFISLLVGAFIASLSATYGGRQRDL